MADNENPTVLLESNDGFQFIVRKSAAMKSSAIKGMLNKRSMIHAFPPSSPIPTTHHIRTHTETETYT